jgi:hypothetical protein
MRSLVRVLTVGSAVALLALPLTLLADVGGTPIASAQQAHAGTTVPATVTASNWTAMPDAVTTGTSTAYQARVSCVTSVFCMKVGNTVLLGSGNYFAQKWNGTTWSSPLPLPAIPSATGEQLSGVSCVTTSYCIAAGFVTLAGGPAPLIEQWNGTAWSIVADSATSTPSLLSGVSCTSVSFCVASGLQPGAHNPFVDQWNGTTWTISTLTNPSGVTGSLPLDMSCVWPSACVMVGFGTTGTGLVGVAWSLNGSTWTGTVPPQGSYTGTQLVSVSCAGASFCAAVGVAAPSSGPNQNLIEIWNGSSWSIASSVPQPSGTGNNGALGVSCFSATSCTAVGFTVPGANEVSEVLTWNGQSWQLATSPNPSGGGSTVLTGVSCLSNWACVAVGNTAGSPTNQLPYDIWAPIARSGYRFVATDGGIFNYGTGAPFLGSMGGMPLNKPIVGMAVMPGGDGYYLVASDGGVFSFGSAKFYGSTGSIVLNKPVVGMAVTPDGGGYWLVASDGGIFAYGDAQFYGSTGSITLNKPVVGMAATPNGNGYYLVASDGGIFSFPTSGGPPFLGSTGSIVLNKPVVGMAVTSAGQYYLVASDGGIFSFPTSGGPPFLGSTGSLVLNKPVIGMALATGGYYLGASDGGIFAFPQTNAGPPFLGSRGGQPLNAPIVGMAS